MSEACLTVFEKIMREQQKDGDDFRFLTIMCIGLLSAAVFLR